MVPFFSNTGPSRTVVCHINKFVLLRYFQLNIGNWGMGWDLYGILRTEGALCQSYEQNQKFMGLTTYEDMYKACEKKKTKIFIGHGFTF